MRRPRRARPVRRADASSRGSTRTRRRRNSASSPRSPAGRSSAPSRASSRCSTSSSTSLRRATSSNVGTFERNFNTRGGAQESRFVGGSAADPRPRWRRELGKRVVLEARRSRRIEQRRRAASTSTPTGHGRGQARDRRRSRRPLAGRIDYRPSLPRERDAAHPAAPAGHADQGHRRLRQAVLARQRADRARSSPTTAASGDLRRLAGGRLARASSSASSAATTRATSPQLARRAARRRDRRLRQVLRAEAAGTRRTTSRPTGRERWSRGCPVGVTAPGALLAYGARCASRSAASTGPAPRRRPTGTATWTAPCARASARRRRSKPRFKVVR